MARGRGRARDISIKWNDREVENPVLRVLVGGLVFIGGGVVIVVTMLVLIVAIPLSLPLHVLLEMFGRRGFVERNANGNFDYRIGREGFRRARP